MFPSDGCHVALAYALWGEDGKHLAGAVRHDYDTGVVPVLPAISRRKARTRLVDKHAALWYDGGYAPCPCLAGCHGFPYETQVFVLFPFAAEPCEEARHVLGRAVVGSGTARGLPHLLLRPPHMDSREPELMQVSLHLRRASEAAEQYVTGVVVTLRQ